MAQSLLEKLDLDDVLVKFKINDRYHAVTGVYLILGMAFNAMSFFNYVFITEEVGYRCVHQKLQYNDSGKIDSFATSWCNNPDLCSEWSYDNPDSFVAEFQLACQDWKRTLVVSVHSFGYMIGLLIVGPLSDRFGRKTLVILTGVTSGVLGPAKSFVTSYWFYVFLEFLEAAIGDIYSPLYMLAIETVATKWRPTYTCICNIGFGIGGLLFALTAWLIPYWRTLLRVMYTPGLLAVLFIFLLDESPRWLLTKGKKTEAVKIVRNAAKINKIEIEENLDMISCEKNDESHFTTAIVKTFKSRPLLKRFLVCFTWWFAGTFVNHGLLINSVSLAGNKYINYALSASMKIPSNILVAYIMAKYNRKGPMILSFVACAVICAVQPLISRNLIWLVVLTYMVGKFTSSMCICVTYIFTSELFPTNTRHSMLALCSSVGRIGTIITPQLFLLAAYWPGLPIVVFAAMSLIAGLVTLFVPDTAVHNLPDTVGQAEDLELKS